MEWYLIMPRDGFRFFMIFTFICIVFHALTIPAEGDRYRKSKADRMINESLNFIYLLYLLCVMNKLSSVSSGSYVSSNLSSFLHVLQYILFAAALVLVIAEAIVVKNYNQLADPIFLLVTLSVFENLNGYFYLGAIASLITYFYLRSGYILIRDRRERKESLSNASINEAVDSLHEGLLFCDESGFVLILNTQMNNLMQSICKKTYRNGIEFYDDISDRKLFPGVERTEMNERPAFKLNGRVWSFSKDFLLLGGKVFFQIAANDVTSLWEATSSLKSTEESLSKRSEELKSAIRNIEDMALENEMNMMKNSFHDVLGHRIALLLRNMRENKEPDEELLKSFAEGFYEEIRDKSSIDESNRLATIVNTMKDIDIEVVTEGELPKTPAYRTLYVDIIREAATNAVRHGFASRIDIEMEQDEESFNLKISNNGILPKDHLIREGGGLTGIRRKLASFDGSLDVSYASKYTLTCRIPKQV